MFLMALFESQTQQKGFSYLLQRYSGGLVWATSLQIQTSVTLISFHEKRLIHLST